MTFSTSSLTDPSIRSQLQAGYDSRKAAAVEAWDERPEQPAEVTLRLSDGSAETLTAITISAEQIEKAFVDFDTWLETTVQLMKATRRH
jgi:hypothetical protein